jgi:hypothetical protein
MQSAVARRNMIIDVGECELCKGFAGEVVVGTDPLPPFHPSCTCTASAAYSV